MGYLMHWAARLLRRLADRRLGPLGLSSAHLPVITALLEREEMSQKELTVAAAIEQPTMAEMLSRMERDGIVARRPDPADKRSTLISLTPSVRQNAVRIREVVQSVNRDSLGALPKAEREPFRLRLIDMISSLEGMLGDEARDEKPRAKSPARGRRRNPVD
jgi:DNA-binding MarR family transcriptional regulator